MVGEMFFSFFFGLQAIYLSFIYQLLRWSSDIHYLHLSTNVSGYLISIKDASLQQLIKDSTDLRNRYRHFFDYTIVNKVIDDTVETIVKHLNDIESASGWIPASWHY